MHAACPRGAVACGRCCLLATRNTTATAWLATRQAPLALTAPDTEAAWGGRGNDRVRSSVQSQQQLRTDKCLDVRIGGTGLRLTSGTQNSNGRSYRVGRGDRRPQLGGHDCPDLPTLAGLVAKHAETWASTRQLSALIAAFNLAVKLGMRPGEAPGDDDHARARLLRTVFARLGPLYQPLVPSLRRPADCTLVLWACGKADHWDPELAAALLARLAHSDCALLRQANGQEHGNLWWALSQAPQTLLASRDAQAALRVSAELLLHFGPARSGPNSPTEGSEGRPGVAESNVVSSQNCANVLLAAARLQRSPAPLLHRMAECLAELAPRASCQDLANALYALGRLADVCGHAPHSHSLRTIAAEVRRRLQEQSRAQGEGLGREQDDGQTQGHAVRRPAAAADRAFKPQELSNMLWGCAKLGCTDDALLQSLTEVSLYNLYMHAAEFKPQELSGVLWALGYLQHEGSQSLLEAAAEECRRRGFRGFGSQELSNAAWALAKAGYGRSQAWQSEWCQGWFAAAVDAALQPGFWAAAESQEVANLLYALALVRHRPPAALLTGMAACGQLRTRAVAQECANGLWALARLFGCLRGDRSGLDAGSRAAVLTLADALAERLRELVLLAPASAQLQQQQQQQLVVVQDVCTSLWALAVLGPAVLSRHGGLAEGLLREVLRTWQAGRWHAGQDYDRMIAHAVQVLHAQPELEALALQARGRAGNGSSRSGAADRELARLAALPGILRTPASGGGGGSGVTMLDCMRADVEARNGSCDLAASATHRQVVRALRRLHARRQRYAQQQQEQRGAQQQQQQHRRGDGGPSIVSIQEQCWVPEVCRHANAVVELAGGRRVTVEVVEPGGLLATPEGALDGGAQLAHTQLARVFGADNVVSVSLPEWQALAGERERDRHLREKLLGLPGPQVVSEAPAVPAAQAESEEPAAPALPEAAPAEAGAAPVAMPQRSGGALRRLLARSRTRATVATSGGGAD